MVPSCYSLLNHHHSPINLDEHMVRNASLGALYLEGFEETQTGHWTLKNDGHSGEYPAYCSAFLSRGRWGWRVRCCSQSYCRSAAAWRWVVAVFQMCTTPSSCTSTGEVQRPTAQSTLWTDADTQWRYSMVSRRSYTVTSHLCKHTDAVQPSLNVSVDFLYFQMHIVNMKSIHPNLSAALDDPTGLAVLGFFIDVSLFLSLVLNYIFKDF